MKANRTLRLLSLLGFLLLMAPFYDSCNGRGMKQADAEAEEVVDSVMVGEPEIIAVDSINQVVEYEEPVFDEIYNFVDDEDSENAFEFAYFNFAIYSDLSFKDFKTSIKEGISKNDYRGLFFHLKNFSFLFIIIISILLIVFSIKANYKKLFRFSITNLILLTITLICIFCEGLFESISQIKWGYYAFIVVQFWIFWKAKILIKNLGT